MDSGQGGMQRGGGRGVRAMRGSGGYLSWAEKEAPLRESPGSSAFTLAPFSSTKIKEECSCVYFPIYLSVLMGKQVDKYIEKQEKTTTTDNIQIQETDTYNTCFEFQKYPGNRYTMSTLVNILNRYVHVYVFMPNSVIIANVRNYSEMIAFLH